MVQITRRLLCAAQRQLSDFVQAAPRLADPYAGDATLRRYLRRNVGDAQAHESMSADLARFGRRIVAEIDELGWRCETDPPRLVNYDAWGERVDRLLLCDAWYRQKDIAASERLVAIGYERGKHAGYHRLYQYAKLLLYSASSGLYSCPLAMTDGAAKVIAELGLERSEVAGETFRRLTSAEPGDFWTSGQWMTERRGGSDVAGGTETVAVGRPRRPGDYRLYGRKWFSSAVDADVALALARSVDSTGSPVEGTGGLSLYLLPVRDAATGQLNNIEVVRLKDKLGTRQLPTAELVLRGSKANMLGPVGRGVPAIAHMLNITRLHNAVASVAAMKRVTQLAVDFAGGRRAFGRRIIDWPLHARTLCEMSLATRGCTLFMLHTAKTLGEAEGGCEAAKSELRLLTPLVKLYTAKMAVSTVSEGLECFGGQGYMEDSRLPAILRDAQVTPIWEGTTNVLSLDALRAMAKDGGECVRHLAAGVERRLAAAEKTSPRAQQALAAAVQSTRAAAGKLGRFDVAQAPAAARDYAFGWARTLIGSLLVDQAAHGDSSDAEVFAAHSWCSQPDLPLVGRVGEYDESAASQAKHMILE